MTELPDRPHPGRPAPSSNAYPLVVCLLGTFRLLSLRPILPLPPDGKTCGLLRALALAPHYALPRGRLLDLLWPDVPTELARQSLNSLVYNLRRALAEALDGAAPVVNGDGCYRLNTGAGVGVDIGQFDYLIDLAHHESSVGKTDAAVRALELAVAWYQGDLWVDDGLEAAVERERLRARQLTALARLADHYFRQGDHARSMTHARRLVAVDACREDGHRIIMLCYAARGERSQALRQFRFCASALRAEFDADPEPATVALYDRIRGGIPPH